MSAKEALKIIDTLSTLEDSREKIADLLAVYAETGTEGEV